MPEPARSGKVAPVLVYGFGITVAMWTAGYLLRLPLIMADSPVLGVAILLCVPIGGFLAGRATGRIGTAAFSGLLSSILNLLVLGALVASDDPERTNALRPGAFLFVPGFLAAGAILGAIGGFLGARKHTEGGDAPCWVHKFALLTASATLLLVVAGGLVTGEEAGMDVPDWPTSFNANMFLFPLSRMVGGIYYEHAHRLFGTLVGLCALVLAGMTLRLDGRRPLKGAAVAAFVAICIQGVLGGLRVTENDIGLAIIHGVFGQLIFALFVAIAAATSPTWLGPLEPKPTPRAGLERKLALSLLVLTVVQISLGALLRHIEAMLHLHITVAVVVFILALLVGIRNWGIYPDLAPLRKGGLTLAGLVIFQFVLGFAALIVAGATRHQEIRPALDVLVTTAHQAVGALLIACTSVLLVWSYRALRTPDPAQPA